MAATSKNNLRNGDLAKIHIAKAQLGLDDETYRVMLWTLARVRSAAELDYAGRLKVLAHLKARGFRSSRSRRSKHADDPLTRKILALWLDLRDQGAITDASDKALGKFCRDVGGADRPEWLSNAAAEKVIEGLKAWLKRVTSGK